MYVLTCVISKDDSKSESAEDQTEAAHEPYSSKDPSRRESESADNPSGRESESTEDQQ
jgi:hypothetical protein